MVVWVILRLTFESPPPLPHSPFSYHHLFFSLSSRPCSFSFNTARFYSTSSNNKHIAHKKRDRFVRNLMRLQQLAVAFLLGVNTRERPVNWWSGWTARLVNWWIGWTVRLVNCASYWVQTEACVQVRTVWCREKQKEVRGRKRGWVLVSDGKDARGEKKQHMAWHAWQQAIQHRCSEKKNNPTIQNITELQKKQKQHSAKDKEDKKEEGGWQEKGGRKSTATGITL